MNERTATIGKVFIGPPKAKHQAALLYDVTKTD